jgi:hypothetical protein
VVGYFGLPPPAKHSSYLLAHLLHLWLYAWHLQLLPAALAAAARSNLL